MTGWNHNTPRDVALREADELELLLNRLPKIRADADTATYHASRLNYTNALHNLKTKLMTRTTHRPTTLAESWNGARFAMLGFRATATTGLEGAMRNWIAQVRKKAGAA